MKIEEKYPQMSQDRLICRISRILCKLKIVEDQKDYLISLISDRIPENVLEEIYYKLNEIYIKNDGEWSSKTNEETIRDYPEESGFDVILM